MEEPTELGSIKNETIYYIKIMNYWTEQHNTLHKTFVFSTFLDAMHWMLKASAEIEKLNHHPKWTNMYTTVEVELSTHDAGNRVTEKDWELARILDAI